MTNKQVILIIEDEKNIGNYIETIVISNGYKALRAMNGMSGLSMCTSHHPDLILLDLGLPDIDGGEVLERVRGFSAVPVIVISQSRSDLKNFWPVSVLLCGTVLRLQVPDRARQFIPGMAWSSILTNGW